MTAQLIIDADAHFMEPVSMWDKYLDPQYKWMAPRSVVDSKGQTKCLIGGEFNYRFDHNFDDTPSNRLKAMDEEGIDIMIMYPSIALQFPSLSEIDGAAALCRAHNNWAHDYRQTNPKRLKGPALVPQQSVAETFKEARRGLTELGCMGVLMRPNPIGGRSFDHPAWDSLWDLLEEHEAPLILHEGTMSNVPTLGVERYGRDHRLYMHMISHPFEHMCAMMSLVLGGVLERHPKLRVLQVEAGCGWLPYWVNRMDHHAMGSASVPNFPAIKLKELPSEYIKRQCVVSADPEEIQQLPSLVQLIGSDSLAFSTDYPHSDHAFKGMTAKALSAPGVSKVDLDKVMGGNVARICGF